MTLCVAWKFALNGKEDIWFAADTCVMLGERPMKFGGIKLFEIPVRYFVPAPAGQEPEVWAKTFGFAFSGSYLAALLVKEMVAAALAELQGPGGVELADFDNICSLVSRFHGHFFREIKLNLTAGESLDFFFGGFCPNAGRVRVARFGIDTMQQTVFYKEILDRSRGESYETTGDPKARKRYEDLFRLSLSGDPCRVHFASFQRLHDVINDDDYDNVAGAIQCGTFNAQGDFQLMATGMLDTASGVPVPKVFIRGTNIDAVHKPGPHGLHVRYTATLPFHDSHAGFEHDGFYSLPQTRVEKDEVVTLLPYDKRWEALYVDERVLLMAKFKYRTVIEHVGSTAVEGMPAVPFVDLMMGFRSSIEIKHLRPSLSALDYQFLGPKEDSPPFHFRKRGGRNVNLFITPHGSDDWQRRILLRDYLRSNPADASEYGRNRMRLINKGCCTLLRYNREKDALVNELFEKACGWNVARSEPVKSKWYSRLWPRR